MKRYEKYILKATEQIKLKLAEPRNGFVVPEVHQGYVASFANSIRQSGLIAAISFYTSTSTKVGSTDYRRNCMMQAIYEIVKEEGSRQPALIYEALEKVYIGINLSLVPLNLKRQDGTAILPNNDELQILQTKIEDAAIALKLALRSFDLQKI